MKLFDKEKTYHPLTTLLAAAVIVLLLLGAVIESAGYTLYDASLPAVRIVGGMAALAVAAVLLAVSVFIELRFLGAQKVKLLPFGAILLAAALELLKVFPQFDRSSINIVSGALVMLSIPVIIITLVRNVRNSRNERAETAVPHKSDVEDIVETTAEDVFPEPEPASGSGSGNELEAAMDGSGAEPNRKNKAVSHREHIAEALRVIASPTDRFYLYNEKRQAMYRYDNESGAIRNCGTADEPGLIPLVASSYADSVDKMISNPGEGETYAEVWNGTAFRPTAIKKYVLNGYSGLYMISLTDVFMTLESESAARKELEAELEQRNKELSTAADDGRRVFYAVNELMTSLVEKRSEESAYHVQAVCTFTGLIMKTAQKLYPELGITNEFIIEVKNAAILHDIGKIEIPDAVLKKPGKLTPEEFDVMKMHANYGENIINRMPYVRGQENAMEYAREIARHHHERVDGNGYPDRLPEEKIPFYVQAVSFADVYEALTSKRVYKDALPHEKAVEMIFSGECGAFSDKILACFRKASDDFREAREEINIHEQHAS